MLINATQNRIVIGRFNILPGDKVPAFPLTESETTAVQSFKNRGMLVEKPSLRQQEAAATVKKPEAKPKEVAKQTAPVDKPKDAPKDSGDLKEENPKAG